MDGQPPKKEAVLRRAWATVVRLRDVILPGLSFCLLFTAYSTVQVRGSSRGPVVALSVP